MFKKLLEHNVTSHDGQFFCHLCMIVQSNLEDILYHVTEEKHQLLQSELTNNVLENCKEQTCKILVDNNIAVVTLSSFYCIVCQRNFKDLISTLQHVQSKYHIDQLKTNYVDINYNKDNSNTCIISLISKLLRAKEKELASFVKSVLFKDTYKNCHLKVFEEYKVQFLSTLRNYSNEDCKILVSNGILKVKYYRLICQYCYQCCLTLDDILQHVKATKHTFELTEKNITLSEKSKAMYTNKLIHRISQHNNANKKLDLLQEVNTNIVSEKLEMKDSQSNLKSNIDYKICSSSCTNCLRKYYHIFLSNKIISQKSSFTCTLCARKIDTLYNTIQHIEGKCHRTKLEYLDKNSNTSQIEYALCTNSNSDGCAIQEVNTNIISKKLEMKDFQSNLKSNIDYKICSSSCTNCLRKYYHIFLSNKIISQKSSFTCTLCARKIDTLYNTIQHIEGKCHRTKLEYLDKNSNTSQIEYALCTNSNSDGCAIQEVNTNIISKKLEMKDFQSNLKFSMSHKICSLSCTNCMRKYYHIFLSNKIISQKSSFTCTLCTRKIDTLYNTLQHIEGKCHRTKLEYLDKNSNTSQIEYALCTNSNSDGCAIQEVNTNIVSEKLEMKDFQSNLKSNIDYKTCSSSYTNCLRKYDQIFLSNEIIIQGSNFICTLCARKIDTLHNTLQHIEGKCHSTKLKDLDKNSNTSNYKIEYALYTNSNSNGSTMQNITTNFLSGEMKDKVVTTIGIEDNNSNAIISECLYYCELCGIQINIKNLNKHIGTLIHKNNILAIGTDNDTLIYKCVCCKSVIQGTSLLINHLNSSKHLNNLTNNLRHIKANNIKIFTQSSNSIQNILKDAKSSLNSIIFPEIANVSMNFSEKQFIFFDVSNMFYNNIKNTIFYFYSICSITLDTTFLAITDNYSIIPNDINTEMMKLICDSPFKNNRMKNHIYKEEKPVKHFNKIYCERYLEIEELMYTLDRKKLDKIKLNFKPFMPYNAKQFYCLACNTNVSKDLDLLYEHACLKPHKINVNIIENNKNSDKLLKQYMQKISSDSVICHICRSCIKNDIDSIDAHINDNMHKKRCTNFHAVINNSFNSIKQYLSNLWYSIQKFSCVLCSINFKYKIQFIEHIITVHNGPLLNQMFDFCIPCATLWLNSSDCYTEHCNDIMHKYLIKNKDFMIEDLPECIQKLLRQVDKTSDILSQGTQILMNDNTHKEIIQSLKNILHSSFPFIKVYLFGSRITGLESANSVIDIFLECGNTYYSDHKEWLRKGNLEIIEEIIRKQTNEWEVKEEIGISKTVIKLLYRRTRVQCDIFITNSLFVKSVKLIRLFNDSYPQCKKLILFIEKWLSYFDLLSMHSLINYYIAWLVIFYLQLNSDLPSVATLIKQKNMYELTCGSKNNNKSMQSVSLLLLGFFQFYANFDYQHYIICPLMGYAVAKEAFINLDTLPKEMKPYINHVRESNNPVYLRIDSPLCVQDPLDLSHNLTKAVKSITLKYFKQYCQSSAFILQQSSLKETINHKHVSVYDLL